jgi:hypothetical protein
VGSVDGADDGTRVVKLSPTDTLRLSRDADSGVMRVELDREGQEPVVRYFEPLEDGMAVRDDAGAVLLQAREQLDGAVMVTDAAGVALAVHSPEDVAKVRQTFLDEGAQGVAQYARNQASLSQGLAAACTE